MVMSVRPPAVSQKAVVPNTPPPQFARHFWPVSPADSISRMTWAGDSSPTYWNSNCETRDGWIRSVTHPFAHVGRLHTFSRGALVVAQSSSLKMQRDAGQATSFAIPRVPLPISQAKWDSLTAGFSSLRAKHGAITCNFTPMRAPAFPLVRGVFSDVQGKIWLAVDAQDGSGWMVLEPNATRAAWIPFAHPANVIVATASRNLLYSVRRDDDNGHVVEVFAIHR